MFVCTCRLYEDEPAEAMHLCETLLQEPDLDPAVRVGDVYGFLVEHLCQQGNYQQVCGHASEQVSMCGSMSQS